MANAITVSKAIGIIAKASAMMFEDKIQFAKTIDMEDPNVYEGFNGFNSGDTIQINKPARFVPGTNADITSSIEDLAEERTPLALDIRRVTAINLTSQEIANDLSLSRWMKRALEPQVSSVAQYVEGDMLQRAIDATFNAVGTPGSTIFDTDTILSANQKINEFSCPDMDNRYVLLTPSAMRSAVNTRKGLFQSSEEIRKQYKSGGMGIADGFTFLMSNILPIHTNGADVTFEVSTTVTTEGATQIVVEGLTPSTAGIVTQGTVFTVATVNAVSPISKKDLGFEQQFVVTADADSDGSGIATLNVQPAIYTAASGGLQSVTAFPADGDTCTVFGVASTSYDQNLAYHRDAFRMVSVPLVLPGGLDMAAQETYEGFTIRVVRDYTIFADQLIMRVDFLGGIASVRPEWAVRIYS